jgi:dihydrofolate reductase
MSVKKQISIVVAIGDNMAIGINNKLLCHLPDDLKMFKKLTDGRTVVMGRNTWFSLPVKPLPNRSSIVISDINGEVFEGAVVVNSIESAVEKMSPDSENFIIGGAMVYRQFMPLADTLYITRIHHAFFADTFFPEIRKDIWRLISTLPHDADERHPFTFTFEIYKRKT